MMKPTNPLPHNLDAPASSQGSPDRSNPKPMRFSSILCPAAQDSNAWEAAQEPEYFCDLNLGQIVTSVTTGWRSYNLKPIFHTPLQNLEVIAYRQHVMQDLEDAAVRRAVTSFSQKLQTMRKRRPDDQEQYYLYEKERWFLNAADTYCNAVKCLSEDLHDCKLISSGMDSFRAYLKVYVASNDFQALAAEIASLNSDLAKVRYWVILNGGSVTVRPYQSAPDYSAVVERTFEKFRRGAAKDYRAQLSPPTGMNHIQAEIIERVAWLYPDTFAALEHFYKHRREYLDNTIARFDREIQFYVSYLTHIDTLRGAGLDFCYPRLSDTSKEITSRGSFDLALADKLVADNATVVTNDFFLRKTERIFIVSGPNQGGKTTFARTFGQLHYLAALGCPVPGAQAKLYLFDRFFTHFEREENIETLRGKLEDDLVRIHQILEQATPNSIIIMNEIFASTTLKDAVYLGKQVLAKMSELDVLGVCVTFLDELTAFNEKTVSMMSTVEPDNPAVRTFKVRRKPADGLAHALAIADKYRVTYDWLKKRIQA